MTTPDTATRAAPMPHAANPAHPGAPLGSTRPLVIYHGNCADGFGAAWVFHHHAKRHDTPAMYPEFVAGRYGYAPPDVDGRDLYLVDFSYSREITEVLVASAARVTLIDHHKTAIEQLAGLPGLRQVVDLERSGATLAWDYLFPNQQRPLLLGHIEDRDLWRFKLPHTREIQSLVFSLPYSFDVWDKLMAADPHDLIAYTAQGAAIERKHRKDVAELVTATRRRMNIAGHNVPAANLPYTMASDAGAVMAQGEPFAAVYWDTPDHRQFSLRSIKGGMDVSTIALALGGGGHENAAGFRVGRDHALARC